MRERMMVTRWSCQLSVYIRDIIIEYSQTISGRVDCTQLKLLDSAVLAKDFEARLDTLLQRRAGMSRIRLGISHLLFNY